MAQLGRNLTDPFDGFLRAKRHLILDRDTKFTAQFQAILERAGVSVVRTAYQAPSMNAFAERWVQSVKRECLDHLALFGEDHLRRMLAEYVAHYYAERLHQGIGNQRIGGKACRIETLAEDVSAASNWSWIALTAAVVCGTRSDFGRPLSRCAPR